MSATDVGQAVEKFFPLGFTKAGELLLHRDDALRLADELERLGVMTYGVSMWYPVEAGIAEVPGNWAIQAEGVTESADDIRSFLRDPLPQRVKSVSLVFEGDEIIEQIDREREAR